MLKNLFFSGFFSLCGCSLTTSETREVPYSAILSYQTEFAINLPGKVDSYFGMHTIRLDSADRLLYLNNSKQLVLLNPVNNTFFTIDFSGYLQNLHLYTAAVSDNGLYFLNQDRLIIYHLVISGTGQLAEKRQIRLNKYVELYQPWLYAGDRPDKQLIQFQNNNTFRIHSHFLYVAYGIYDREHEFRDTYAYLKIDTDDSTALPQKVLFLPGVFRTGKYRDDDTFLNFLRNGDHIYSFMFQDSVYRLDSMERIITAGLLNSNAHFKAFNRKKRRDLGYVRVYTATNEANTVTVTGRKDEIMVIKKLAKEKINDPDLFDMYILDASLHVKYKNRLPFRLHFYHHTYFQKGFLLFNAAMDKAYYYETP